MSDHSDEEISKEIGPASRVVGERIEEFIFGGGVSYEFINMPGTEPRKALCYYVPNGLADLFTERGICDLIWKFIAEFSHREIKTISAYSAHSDREGFTAFFHPSMKPEDQEPFIAMLEERKAGMLARFPTSVLELELVKRANDHNCIANISYTTKTPPSDKWRE